MSLTGHANCRETLDQHAVVEALSRIIEVRAIGDPMQGIFDFGEHRDRAISWTRHVQAAFPVAARDMSPWRWKDTPALREFVGQLRSQILTGSDISLDHPAVDRVLNHQPNILNMLRASARLHQRTLVIRGQRNQCYRLAKALGSIYRCVEPIDSDVLSELLSRLSVVTGMDLPVAVLGFVKSCVKDNDKDIDKTLARLQSKSKRTVRAPSPTVGAMVDASRRLAESRSLTDLIALIGLFDGQYAFRSEPIRIVRQAANAATDLAGLPEAIVSIRERDRHRGRHLPPYALATTLLVKGMSAEHVVVMDVDQMSAAHLYVALTRATKRLTVVSNLVALPAPGRSAALQEAIQAGLLG